MPRGQVQPRATRAASALAGGRGAAGRADGRGGGRNGAAGDNRVVSKAYGGVPSQFGSDNPGKLKNFAKGLDVFSKRDGIEAWAAFLDLCVSQSMTAIGMCNEGVFKMLVATLPRFGWRQQGETWVRVITASVEDQLFGAQQVYTALKDVLATVAANASRDHPADTEDERAAQRQRTDREGGFEDTTEAVFTAAAAAAAAAASRAPAGREIPLAPASTPTLADLTRDEAIQGAVQAMQRGLPFQAIQPRLNVSGMRSLPEGNRPGVGGGPRAPLGRGFSNFSGGAAEMWGQNPFSSTNMVLEVSPSGGLTAREYGPTTARILVGKWEDVLRALSQDPERASEYAHVFEYIHWMNCAFLDGQSFTTVLAVDKDARQRWNREGGVTFDRAILDSAMAVIIAGSARVGPAYTPRPPRGDGGGGRGCGGHGDGRPKGGGRGMCNDFKKSDRLHVWK